MKSTAILAFIFISLPVLAQIPAASFDPQIVAGKQTYDGLRAQLEITQKQLEVTKDQLVKVQGANTQLGKDLSTAQAQLALCKP